MNVIKALLSANTWTSGLIVNIQFLTGSGFIQHSMLCLYLCERMAVFNCVYMCVCLNIQYLVIRMRKQHFTSVFIWAFPLCTWLGSLAISQFPQWPPPPTASTLQGLRQLDWTGDQCWGNSLIMAWINDEKFGVIQWAPGYLSLGKRGLPIGTS